MKIFIDRFENDFAICEAEGKPFFLPRWVLPKCAVEGDVLNLTLTLDPETKAFQKSKITSLEDKLFR